MIGLRGRFGLLLTTGDILRITSIGALHQSPTGIVLLDHGGVPDGIDLARQPKRYLGAPVPGALRTSWLRLSSSLRKLSNSRVTPPCSWDRTLRLVRLRTAPSPKP